MAVQRNTQRRSYGRSRKSRKNQGFLIFWLLFFVVLLFLFLINRENIRETLETAGLWGHFFQSPGTEETGPEPPEPEPEPSLPRPPVPSPVTEPRGPLSVEQPSSETSPVVPAPSITETSPAPASQPPAPSSAPSGSSAPAESQRTRAIYFMQVDKSGDILRRQVNRTIPASDSPLLDTLQALLRGPTAEEQRRSFISLIPQGTRLLSAQVRGSTAYLNFSEEFQFNSNGVEGYAAQIRQIVWTTTEFSNVKDVQFLIEGRRIDYLGENIRVGSPISRDF